MRETKFAVGQRITYAPTIQTGLPRTRVYLGVVVELGPYLRSRTYRVQLERVVTPEGAPKDGRLPTDAPILVSENELRAGWPEAPHA